MRLTRPNIAIVTTLALHASPSYSFTFLSRHMSRHASTKSIKRSLFLYYGLDSSPDNNDQSSSSSSSSSASADEWKTNGMEWITEMSKSESLPLNPISLTKERRNRMKREAEVRKRFLQDSDELHDLRLKVKAMQSEVRQAMREQDVDRIDELHRNIAIAQNKDAEHVYQKAKKNLRDAVLNDEATAIITSLEREVMDARSAIPHFNLEGMWVGKYGTHGYEIINVTYIGETLVAYKVTGDQNVPKGEITFQADLSGDAAEQLEPISLTESAAKQWGIKHLPRFPGKGQAASEGFQNAQWMEGQLITVGDYFSFAWVPIGHQIFFGRPSPELTLKMLRENDRVNLANDGTKKMRDYALRCMEETIAIEEEECDVFGEGCFE